jgi:hypothetical protein
MNIAISSVIMVMIILPGLLFFRGYYSNEFSSKYFKASISKLIPSILIPAFLFHTLLFLLTKFPFVKCTPNIEYVGILLTSKDTSELKIVFNNISQFGTSVFYYFSLIYLLASVTGYFSWFTIRKTKLDRKIPVLRYPNRWYYILTGEIFDFPQKDKNNDKFKNSKDIKIRYVDVLVQIGDNSIIYSGILHNFILSKENTGVECIKLRNVKRKELSINGRKNIEIDKIAGE